MNYLYITLNKAASQYAISLDEIFLTLYGFGKKKRLAGAGMLKKKSYSNSAALMRKEIPGVVYRVSVTDEQHDKVRDILCDFLIQSQMNRYRFNKKGTDFSSLEFIAYILESAEIANFPNGMEGVTSESIRALTDLENVDIFYEGDLRQYVAVVRAASTEIRTRSDIKPARPISQNKGILHSIKQNEKIMERGTAQYEYVPNEV